MEIHECVPDASERKHLAVIVNHLRREDEIGWEQRRVLGSLFDASCDASRKDGVAYHKERTDHENGTDGGH